MTAEKSQLRLVATDDWSVQDLYYFFHQLNILYNRLLVIDHEIRRGKVRKLQPLLSGSLSKVDVEEQLQLESIEIHSPAEINLKGVGELVRELREGWKDFRFRNRIEEERLELVLEKERSEFAHKQKMQNLEEISKTDEIVFRRISELKKRGYSDDEIRYATKALSAPMNNLIEFSESKQIQAKSADGE